MKRCETHYQITRLSSLVLCWNVYYSNVLNLTLAVRYYDSLTTLMHYSRVDDFYRASQRLCKAQNVLCYFCLSVLYTHVMYRIYCRNGLTHRPTSYHTVSLSTSFYEVSQMKCMQPQDVVVSVTLINNTRRSHYVRLLRLYFLPCDALIRADYAVVRRPSVHLSVTRGIVSKRLHMSSNFFTVG